MVMKRTLESPLDSEEIKTVNPKGNQPPEYSLQGLMLTKQTLTPKVAVLMAQTSSYECCQLPLSLRIPRVLDDWALGDGAHRTLPGVGSLSRPPLSLQKKPLGLPGCPRQLQLLPETSPCP